MKKLAPTLAALVVGLLPSSAFAVDWYVKACPDVPNCRNADKEWVVIPSGTLDGLDLDMLSMVVGSGLLMWAVGLGIGMAIFAVRKMR